MLPRVLRPLLSGDFIRPALWGRAIATAERRFLQNVGVLTFANSLVAVTILVQAALVARYLGPELYGVAALILAYPNLVHAFFDSRSSEATVKYLGEFRARGEDARALATVKLGYAIDLVIVVAAFATVAWTADFAAARIVHRPEMEALVLVAAAGLLPRALVGTSRGALMALGRFSTVAGLDVCGTLLRALLVCGLVLGGGGVAAVAWGSALAALGSGLLHASAATAAVHRVWGGSPLHGDLRCLQGRYREMLRFLAYNDLSVLATTISKQADVAILGYFHGPEPVGFYKLAKSLASASGYLLGPLQSVVYPELVRLKEARNPAALARAIRRLSLGVGLPLGCAVAAVAFLAPAVLPILVGGAYGEAAPATRLLLWGSAIAFSCFWVRPLYLALGNVREWLTLSSLVAVLSLAAYLWIVPRGGLLGLAGWSLFAQAISHTLAVGWLAWRPGRSLVIPATPRLA